MHVVLHVLRHREHRSKAPASWLFILVDQRVYPTRVSSNLLKRWLTRASSNSDNDYGNLAKNGFGCEIAMSTLLDGKGLPFRRAFSAVLGRGL